VNEGEALANLIEFGRLLTPLGIRESRALLRRGPGLAAAAVRADYRIPVEQVAHLDTYGNRAWLKG
jgi:hypothetical protein